MSKWMNLASKVARHSEVNYQLGAVIVRGGNVLETGFNKKRNNAANCDKIEDAHTHAEMDALKNCSNPKGATLYVCRVLASEDHLSTSKPCHRCAYEMQEAGIKKVVYINDDGFEESYKFRGDVNCWKSAYAKANKKFNQANHAFKNVSYAWDLA